MPFVPRTLMLLLACLLAFARTGSAFELNDGDVVAFYGDSNTEWGSYPQIVEAYTHVRFPNRKVTFFNGGKAGDTASSSVYWRFENDVLHRSPRPNKVFVMFGVNDLALGNPDLLTPHMTEAFREGVAEILKRCKRMGIQAYFLSYPPVEYPEPATFAKNAWLKGLHRLVGEASPLSEISAYAMKAAREAGQKAIDARAIMRPFVEPSIQGTVPRYHWKDGLHLNEAGNQLLAYAILRELGAPESVSSVEINLDSNGSAKLVSSDGAEVRDLKSDGPRSILFSRRDAGLPFVQGFFERGHEPESVAPSAAEHEARACISTPDRDRAPAAIDKIPAPSTPMNRFADYRLKVTGLPEGRYIIRADKEFLEPSFTSAQLAEGILLSYVGYEPYFPHSPWGSVSREATLSGRAKALLEAKRFNLFWSATNFPAVDRKIRKLDAEIFRLSEQSRTESKPWPIRFEIAPFAASRGVK